jgi:hypothetical protein
VRAASPAAARSVLVRWTTLRSSPAGLIEGSGHIWSDWYTHSAWITQMSMVMTVIAQKRPMG